ncbi:MAG: hypothetical protein PF447_12665 [Spirochaetaceae bacterium]|nr:hypothetical protein [Spirochaetaceae bacterium]
MFYNWGTITFLPLPYFYRLLGLFWMNLFLCTIKRFNMQLKKTSQRYFGPDILHRGLFLLIVFSLGSGFTRREALGI